MKAFLAATFLWGLATTAGLADHLIPADSEAAWDFRGKAHESRGAADDLTANLYNCKTYEELRTRLVEAIPKLEKLEDDFVAVTSLHSCKLALIRTYYILGAHKTADRLMNAFCGISNRPHFADYPEERSLNPLPSEEHGEEDQKAPESTPAPTSQPEK